jgi:hypothetical protein
MIDKIVYQYVEIQMQIAPFSHADSTPVSHLSANSVQVSLDAFSR